MREKILLFLLVVGCVTNSFATTYYVATNGSDSNNNGTSLSTPFRTIQKAASVAVAGDVVNVRTGTYRETVIPTNSGTAGNPITFQPYNGETVTISGADPITTAWTVHSGSIYKTAMSANWMDKSNNQADQVFVNNSMVHLARWPNMPTSLDPSYPNKITCNTFVSKVTTGDTGTPAGGYTTGSLSASTAPPPNSVGAEICVQPNYEAWSWIFSGKLTGQSGGTITFTSFSGSGKDFNQNIYDPQSRYFLFNKLSLLDAPGEWYHDDATNQLYLWSPNGGVPANVEAKKREYAFNVSNRNYITIKGFNLFACAITTDDFSGGDHKQYRIIGDRGETVYPWRGSNNPLASSQNCIIDGINAKYLTHFTDVSGFTQFQWGMGSGIVISGSNHIVRNCTIDYSAGNGITILGRKNKALNNVITNTDYSATDCAAIHTGGVANITIEDNEIAYNTVRKTGRSGMTPRANVNSSFTNFEARLHHNVISEFLLQDWDGAGVYVTGDERAPHSMRYFRMDHNIVYGGRGYQVAGLYTDYTSGVMIDHNLIYDVDVAIKVQGWDPTTKVNNTLIYNNTTMVRKTVPSNYDTPFSFGNSASYNGTSNVGSVVKNNIAIATTDGNERVYQSPPGGYQPFQLWNNAIKTPNHLHAQGDPLFTNWAGLNFTLQAASGAVNTGETLTSVVRDGITIPYFNDAVVGQVDMGAFERGTAPWGAGAGLANTPVAGISLPSTATVGIGLKVFLPATFTPSNATNQSVVWSSNNTNIATVSTNGQVTGVALGNATITATSVDGSFTSTTTVTVRPYNVGENVIAINAGGNQYGTAAGVPYLADAYFTNGNGGTSGYFFTGTDDHEIYRSLRYGGDFSYRIPVLNNQAYTVTLNFVNWSSGAGADMGNVFAEGVQVLTNTDAYVASGNQNLKPYNVTLSAFTVTDGFIDLRFVGTGTGQFSVCGISVVAAGGGTSGDTTPPSNPTNLTPTNITSNSFTLGWSASTDNEGVVGYDVYRGTTLVGSTTTATTINVTGLTGSTTYSMTVRARDAAGYSATSSALDVPTIASTGTLRDPENPSSTVAGLDYKYYEGSWSLLPNFDNLTAVKTGTVTNFDLAPRNRNDDFGFSYTGYVNIPADGVYTFYTSSDDGSKLYIGNTQVVSNDGLHAAVEQSGTIGLKAGKHALTVVFFEAGGGEELSVSYSGPSLSKVSIPSSALSRLSTQTADTTPPSVPTGLSSANVAQTSFTLNWSPSTDAVGVTGYEVFQDGTPIGTSTSPTFNVTGLTANTGYSMRVRARDAVPNWSAQSIALTVNTIASTGTLRDPENPSSTVAGLDYKYYEGSWSVLPNFDNLTAVKTGTVTNFDLAPRNRNDNFGFSYTGYVNIPADGIYTFYTTSDDGSKLYIGNTQVVNNDGLHGSVEQSGTIGLKAGKHALTVVFFEAGGGEELSVRYSSPALSKVTIPSSALSRLSTQTADTTPPSVPTGLSSANVSQTSFTLNWAPSTDAVGVTGYEVFQNGTPIGTSTSPTFNVTGLTANTAYSMRVRARDAVPNWSAQSNALSVTTSNVAPSSIRIEAENYSSGSVGFCGAGGGTGTTLGCMGTSSVLVYNNITLSGQNRFTASLANQNGPVNIEVRVGSPSGTIIGTMVAGSTGSWTTYVEQAIPITALTGTYNVYITFSNAPYGAVNLDWIQFDYTSQNIMAVDNSSSALTIDKQRSDSVNAYPNPATTSFKLSAPSEISKITVTDLSGKVITTLNPSGNVATIDCNSWSAGVYIVQVETDGETIVKKVVIEK